MATFSRSTFALSKLLKPTVSGSNAYKVDALKIRHKSVVSSKLMYAEYGDPVKVIKKCQEELPATLNPTEILVKMLAAPVNPADINTIQGKYPSRPSMPAVAGNEGVGEVLKIGSDVQEFAVGDHVVPLTTGLGTWRTHAVFPKHLSFKVPKKLGLVEAATLTVNPCTAYRMLRDFVCLKPGDTMIQNGANSACGQNVIQICRIWGIRSVNIVRDRENVGELKKYLTDLGATHVLTEEELRKTDMFKSGKVAKPRLALNCVGGKNAVEVLRTLEAGSPMVTYGGMSREPVIVPTSALIFKNVKVYGFWMTRWTKENFDSEERNEMLEELIALMVGKELRGPACKMINFDNYEEALSNSLNVKGMIGKKYILEFTSC